jgi:phosphatidylglycerol:prolipoprotein diacylglycerol transferase
MFALTWRRKLTTGSYIAAVALCYSPVRFAMDFLRVKDMENADPRYGHLTPAQWSCVALFTFGLVMVAKITQLRRTGQDPMELLYAKTPGAARPPDVPIEAA